VELHLHAFFQRLGVSLPGNLNLLFNNERGLPEVAVLVNLNLVGARLKGAKLFGFGELEELGEFLRVSLPLEFRNRLALQIPDDEVLGVVLGVELRGSREVVLEGREHDLGDVGLEQLQLFLAGVGIY